MKQFNKLSDFLKGCFGWLVNTVFILAVYTKVVNSHEQRGCGQEELIKCAQPLQAISDSTEFSFVASKKEIDQLCPDLENGLRCIHSYTRRCMNFQQKEHFNKLYKGTSQVIKDLCQNPAYQEEFLRHAPCMRGVVREYEICTKKYQATMEAIANPPQRNNTQQDEYQNEAETIKSVCCSFQEYMHCSQRTMRHACGEDTARFTKAFLDRMASSLIKLHCSEYAEDTSKCGLGSSSLSLTSSVLTSLLLPIAALLIIR